MQYKIKKINVHQQKQLSKVLVKTYFKSYANKGVFFPSTLRNKYLMNLKNLRKYIKNPYCNIYVAISNKNKILGGVFYYSNIKEYGFKLKLNQNKTCAIRYLAVDEKYRSLGIGKALIKQCISHSRQDKNRRIVLHTMDTMKEASKIYSNYGFFRYKKIDFKINSITIKAYTKTL